MDSLDSSPLPGTTLKVIAEEHEILQQFRGLMRKRLDLEAEHLEQLREFQATIDPSWSSSGVWSLISPIIQLWTSQLDRIESMQNAVIDILESLPDVQSPSAPDRNHTTVPSTHYKRVMKTYTAYKTQHEAASNDRVKAEMKDWMERLEYVKEPTIPGNTNAFTLPEVDRKYRESVVAHRASLENGYKWHSNSLSTRLEVHQQQAEDLRDCLVRYLVKQGDYTADSSRLLSKAQKEMANFSSLVFIDSNQTRKSAETNHPTFQWPIYYNHALGGTPAEPALGVLSELAGMVYKLQEKAVANIWNQVWIKGGDIKFVFLLERECVGQGDILEAVVEKFSKRYGPGVLIYVALSVLPPLLPMKDRDIRRFSNSIRRQDLIEFMRPISSEQSHLIYAIIILFSPKPWELDFVVRWIVGDPASEWPANQLYGGNLLKDIWRKWGFNRHQVLPSGVHRMIPDSSTSFSWAECETYEKKDMPRSRNK